MFLSSFSRVNEKTFIVYCALEYMIPIDAIIVSCVVVIAAVAFFILLILWFNEKKKFSPKLEELKTGARKMEDSSLIS
jgi:hypothetical protein